MSQPEDSGCSSNVVHSPAPNAQFNTLSLEDDREITFVFPGEDIRVSKSFLASSGPVFKSMFEDDKNEVPITDMDADTFKCMLRYINGRALPEDKEAFNKLLAAAEKYELHKVDTLRMMSSFTKDNWLDTLEKALLDKNPKLTRALFDFLFWVPNMEEIVRDHKFLELSKDNFAFYKIITQAYSDAKEKKQLEFHSDAVSASRKSTRMIFNDCPVHPKEMQWYADLKAAGSKCLNPVVKRMLEIKKEVQAAGYPMDHPRYHALLKERVLSDKKIWWCNLDPHGYFY